MTQVPLFDDLPLLGDLRMRHSWGVFGDEDNLGTLNNLTPELVAASTAEVVTGARYPLSLPLHEPDPPNHGRRPFVHEIFSSARNSWDDRLHDFPLQGSSQWDGFSHARAREYGFYGGVTDDPAPRKDRLSIHHFATQGIIGRGVLLDIARNLDREYDPLGEDKITGDDLRQVAERQGVQIQPGDILCLRFGWMDAYRGMSREAKEKMATEHRPSFVGLAGDEEISRTLWNWRVAAVTSDNPAVEGAPFVPSDGSLHRRVIPCLGMVLGELFDFDPIAEVSAADGRYTFMFVGVPLALVGGIGSPANAVAIR